MLIKFKKSGRTTDSSAGEKFIRLGIAERVNAPDKIHPEETVVVPAKESNQKKKVNKKPVKRRGRPRKK